MVILDSNLLLEILEERRYYNEVRNYLERCVQNGDSLAVSTLTVSNTFYLAERHKVPNNRVETLITTFQIFDVVTADVNWALVHYEGRDFEDALQIAAALREKCTAFLTLDTSLAKKYEKFLNIELIS